MVEVPWYVKCITESDFDSVLLFAKPEEGNSGCQSRYLSEYKTTQPPGERTGRTRRKSPHYTETGPRGESLDCKLQARSPRNNRADTGRIRRDQHLELANSNRRWQGQRSDHSKSRRHTRRSHPCHRRVPELVEQFREHLMLPVKSEARTY